MGGSGDFEQGERLFQKAISFALEIDHRSTIGWAVYGYGATLALKGDGKSAAKHVQNAIKYLEESQSVLFLGQAWAWLGYAHCLMGKPETAVEFTEKGLKMLTDLGVPFWRSMCHWFCSCSHFELGSLEEARTHADLALQFSVENNERQLQGLSRMWLGRVMAKTDATKTEAAEQKIQQGISLLEELGIRSQAAYGFLWLGEVLADAGRREEALVNLKKAEGMFGDMGMDYWLGKAQEALARL
jgi:tetratricopeptide (TPR) repeat protein